MERTAPDRYYPYPTLLCAVPTFYALFNMSVRRVVPEARVVEYAAVPARCGRRCRTAKHNYDCPARGRSGLAAIALLRRVLPIALLFVTTYAQAEKYPADVTRLPAPQEPFVPGWSRLGIIDDDWYLSTRRHLSHITAIAPVVTMLSNLTAVPSASYSIHYQPQIPRSKIGKGVFKRGVFASDAPIPDCTICAGAGGVGIGATTIVNSTGSTSLPCSTIPYDVRLHTSLGS